MHPPEHRNRAFKNTHLAPALKTSTVTSTARPTTVRPSVSGSPAHLRATRKASAGGAVSGLSWVTAVTTTPRASAVRRRRGTARMIRRGGGNGEKKWNERRPRPQTHCPRRAPRTLKKWRRQMRGRRAHALCAALTVRRPQSRPRCPTHPPPLPPHPHPLRRLRPAPACPAPP